MPCTTHPVQASAVTSYRCSPGSSATSTSTSKSVASVLRLSSRLLIVIDTRRTRAGWPGSTRLCGLCRSPWHYGTAFLSSPIPSFPTGLRQPPAAPARLRAAVDGRRHPAAAAAAAAAPHFLQSGAQHEADQGAEEHGGGVCGRAGMCGRAYAGGRMGTFCKRC